MFPKRFVVKVFRSTIVGGAGVIIGGIIGGLVFGIIAAIIVAIVGGLSQMDPDVTSLLEALSGIWGFMWGAGIGAMAGLLTGVLLVVFEPADSQDGAGEAPWGKPKLAD